MVEQHNIYFEVLSNKTTVQSKRTEQRLQHFSQRPLVLLETTVTYQTQLQGRFRWEVEVTLTCVDTTENMLQRKFNTPVFHQFHHEVLILQSFFLYTSQVMVIVSKLLHLYL